MPLWPPRSDAVAARSPQRYVLHGGGPPAPFDEVEHPARFAIEVLVLWRGDVLAVSHLAPPGIFFFGGVSSSCDVSLPVELLGAERLCIAVASRSEVSAVLLPQARGWLTLPDGSTRPLDPAPRASLPPGHAVASERLLPLGAGHRVHLCFGAIEIQIAPVPAGRAPVRRRSIGFDPATLAYFGLSSLSVAGVLALLSLMAPPLGLTQDERAEAARLYLLQSYLTASAERVTTPKEQASAASARAFAAARPAAPPREAVEAEAERSSSPAPLLELTDPATARPGSLDRSGEIEQARGFGIIGLFKGLEALNDPRLPFERELSGAEVALMDQLFNSDPMGEEGPAGLSLSGTGLRGGSKADLLALGPVRTVAGGQGGGVERFSYLGSPTGSYRPHPPSLRPSDGTLPGPLPAAAIRRTVQAQFAKIRGCFEAGRASHPMLAGTAIVRFVVQPDGQPDAIRAEGADLPTGVRSCIEGVFRGLSFPNPESRPVDVAYPIDLFL